MFEKKYTKEDINGIDRKWREANHKLAQQVLELSKLDDSIPAIRTFRIYPYDGLPVEVSAHKVGTYDSVYRFDRIVERTRKANWTDTSCTPKAYLIDRVEACAFVHLDGVRMIVEVINDVEVPAEAAGSGDPADD